MDSKSLQEHAKRVALEQPFTEHCWPFGPEFDVFKVGGKIFMIVAVAHGRPHVSLKSDPEKSLLNQQIYRGIEPGYHLNKKHWISLYGTEDMTPELVADLIADSWNLIVDKLPKKIRSGYARSDCSAETNSISARIALIFSRIAL
jgi:predicted DNA-binding protein (MmcQ/YjbR family)